MSWKSKVAIIASVIAAIVALLFIIKVQNDLLEKQNNLSKSMVEQKEISDNIVRSQTNLVTKADLEDYAKAIKLNLDPIQDDLNKLNADLQGIQTTKIVSTGYVGTNLNSTGTTPRDPVTDFVPDPAQEPNVDPYGYHLSRQYLDLAEKIGGDSVPIGSVGFSAWQDKPWDVNILPREYTVTSVLGQDDNDKHYLYNTVTVKVGDKTYDMKVIETKFIEKSAENSFSFNPRLYAGLDAGAYLTKPSGAVVTDLQISLFSYGRMKADPDLSFAGVGGGFDFVDNQVSFVLSPITYNVGHDLPLVENVHVRPTIGLTGKGDWQLMAGVGFGL